MTDLERWETRFLDTDGKVKRILHRLHNGHNVFSHLYLGQAGDLILSKYSYLLEEMPRRPSDDIAIGIAFGSMRTAS